MADSPFRTLNESTAENASAWVYWFTHAGGSTNTLAHRLRSLPGETPFVVRSPWMPGREGVEPVPHAAELTDFAEEFATAIRRELSPGRPPVLVGHSFGSIVAYEVARELLRQDAPPHRLVVLSFPPPDRLHYETKLHTLDDEALLEEVDRKFGGIPRGIREDPAARGFFVPALRFDLALLENYQPRVPLAPLTIPVTAICGTEDRAVDLAEMQGWTRVTDRPIRLRGMPGDHFFPLERMAEVLDAAAWDLRPAG